MPEDIKPPKTIAEMGVHIVYMSKSINTMQKTLEKMIDGSVTKAEFDDHVVWGQAIVKEHDERLKVLEDDRKLEKHSVWHKLSKQLEERAVLFIAMLILAAFVYFIVATSRLQPEDISPFIN